MKLFLVALALSPIFAFGSVSSEENYIQARHESGRTVQIILNVDGTPRIKGMRTYPPSIKDFRDDSGQFTNYCYVGGNEEMNALFTALVARADGDGDSWATLKKIKVLRHDTYLVVVAIEDERGAYTEEYRFPQCLQAQ
ncbi:MAG: hypothetical protein IT289_10040 [Oligoflexia bacterium]|nr:hypothetical protein [Oligoflexia bacterium]